MLEKLKKLQVNFSLVAMAIFMGKMIITQPSFADSVIIAVLGVAYSYSQYLKRFQPYNLDAAIVKDLAEVKGALSKMNLIQARQTDPNAPQKKYFG